MISSSLLKDPIIDTTTGQPELIVHFILQHQQLPHQEYLYDSSQEVEGEGYDQIDYKDYLQLRLCLKHIVFVISYHIHVAFVLVVRPLHIYVLDDPIPEEEDYWSVVEIVNVAGGSE